MEVNQTTGFHTIISLNVKLNDLQIFVLIIELIIGTVTVVGSLVVLALFYHERKDNKNSHRYFTAMAIGDLVFGLVNPSIVIYFSFGVTVSDPYCTKIVVFGCIPILYSLFLMLAMSVDRYFAIMKPIEYKSKMTKEITYCVICGCLVLSLLTVGIFFTGLKEPDHPDALCFVFSEYFEMGFSMFFLSGLVTPCLIAFVYSYVRIYKVILDAMGTNASHTSKFLELGKIVVRRNTKTSITEDKMLYGRFKVREVRTTVILFITVVLFLLVWVPGMVLSALLYVAPEYATMEGIITVLVLSQLNSMVNPFLFARNIKNADKIVKSLFKRMLCIKTEKFVNSTTPST